jgi:S1-C subfamily serine protease
MRAAFGLVSLLVAVGLIAWLMSKGIGTEGTDKQTQARIADAAQIAGYSRDQSMPFLDSLSVEPQMTGGKFSSLLVMKVAKGGPADTYFGLKEGDAIIAASSQGVETRTRDEQDATMFRDEYLFNAYKATGTITVMRNGQQLILPSTTPAAKSANAANSSNPTDALQGLTNP